MINSTTCIYWIDEFSFFFFFFKKKKKKKIKNHYSLGMVVTV